MQFTSNYDSRVVNYDRKMFIRLATGRDQCCSNEMILWAGEREGALEPVLKRFYSVNFMLGKFFKHSDWLKLLKSQSKCLKKCSFKFTL